MPYRSPPRRLLAAVAASVLALATAAWATVAYPAPAAAGPAAVTPPSSVVSLLKPQHPRLLASAGDFTAAKNRVTSDQRTATWYDKVKRDADDILTKPVSTYNLSPDLLQTAREVKRRSYTLALVYRISDDTKYAARAAEELVAGAQFPNWNPAHFLDVGEMTNAEAIGYDWLYDYLSVAQRTTIRNGIKTNGLQAALDAFNQGQSFYTDDPSNNWSIVANAVALGALAIGDEEPTIADDVLKRSITSIQHGISEYAPGGGFAESPTYWDYATEYLVDYLAAFNTALGTDFGLSDLPGVAKTGDFAEYVTGPLGEPFNAQNFDFGDGIPYWQNVVTNGWQTFPMMWLANRYNRPDWAQWEAKQADTYASPMDILWYDPAYAASPAHPAATDAYFAGAELASARSSWDDPYATWVATKGLRSGFDSVVGHEDLDAGDVMLDALGVRWFENLGADNYSLPGYFDWNKTTGGRWDYYVTRAEGQNTFQLGSGPDPKTALTSGAKITKVGSAPQQWYTITDLTGMYAGVAERAQRGVKLSDDRHQVLVQDEVQASKSTDYWSFLHTRASVAVAADGRSAMLSLDGQRLWLQLVGPSGAQLLTGSATPLPTSPNPAGQNPQNGVHTIMVHLASTTSATVALRMVPLASGQRPPTDTPTVTPLSQWSTPAANPPALTGITLDGKPLPGFAAHTYSYDTTLAWNAKRAPKVGPVGAGADVTQASGAPGTAVLAMPKGGPRYTVNFRVPGKTATALPVRAVSASTDDSDPAAHAMDDNPSTRWSADGDGQTLTFDLGTTRTVGAVNAALYNGDQRTATFDLRTSTDNSNWTTVRSGARSSGTTIDYEAYDFPPVSARYVRVVGHGNSQSTFNSINEVRLYASGADARAELSPRPVVLSKVNVLPATAPTLKAGEVLQLSLAGTNTDGSTADLSAASVSWRSMTPSVVTVDGSGLLTAKGQGSGEVTALVVSGPVLKIVRYGVFIGDPAHLEPAGDAWVRDGSYLNSNYGADAQLWVQNNIRANTGDDRITYVTFELSGLSGAAVAKAEFHIYGGITDGSATSASNAVYAAATPFAESTLTWGNRPGLGTWLGSVNTTDAASWHVLDLTSYVTSQLAGSQQVTFGIVSNAAATGPHQAFNSKEATDDHPYLGLTLS